MPCCVTATPCLGPVQAHHATYGRGRGQKVDDSLVFPLCLGHHRAFHDASGLFKSWTKARRREWQEAMVEEHRETGDE